MEKNHFCWALIVSFIIILGSISFTLCFAAEFKKSKKRDLRLDGKLCYLPESDAFGLGIAALVLLFIAEIIGNLLICKEFCTKSDHQSNCNKAKRPFIVIISLSLSWIGFGGVFVLMGAATSMNKSQKFGEGWLDGECYLVKDGVFIGSAILVLITLASLITSAIILGRRRKDEQGTKVHAQQQQQPQ